MALCENNQACLENIYEFVQFGADPNKNLDQVNLNT